MHLALHRTEPTKDCRLIYCRPSCNLCPKVTETALRFPSSSPGSKLAKLFRWPKLVGWTPSLESWRRFWSYGMTTKISPKTGPKTQKSASEPGHLRNRKKRCCKPKNWGQKVEKHVFFSLFACRFWTGAFTNRCPPYCSLQCFLKASVTTDQKHRVLAEKCPPPPVKPVTSCNLLRVPSGRSRPSTFGAGGFFSSMFVLLS